MFENVSIVEYKQEESKHLKNIRKKKIQLDNRPMNELKKKNIRLIKKKKSSEPRQRRSVPNCENKAV